MASKVDVIQKQIYKAGLRLAYTLNSLSRKKNFTHVTDGPKKNKICPLKAEMKIKNEKVNVDANLVLTPAEQALATVLSSNVCDIDFLKDLYLARISEAEVQK
jgi:hypothetical protein